MRVPVWTLVVVHVVGADTKVVVLIVHVRGRQSTQEGQQVLEQQWLIFLNAHRHRGVTRDNGHNSVLYACAANSRRDVVGDIHQLDRLARRERQSPQSYRGAGSVIGYQLHCGASMDLLMRL